MADHEQDASGREGSLYAGGIDAVYVRRDDDGVVYGSSIHELVQRAPGPLTPDWRAWACQFYFGHPLGRRTQFSEISLLRPGETRLPEDDLDAVVAPAAEPQLPRVTDLSVAVAGVAERLLAAVGRGLARAQAPACFSNGAGVSRALVACLARLVPGAAFDCFICPTDEGHDEAERLAEQAAAALGARPRVLAPSYVLSRPVASTFERLARDALARELALYAPERRVLWFLLNNRAWRGQAPAVRLQARSLGVELPCLDAELWRYALGVDDSVRLSPEFYPALVGALEQGLPRAPSASAQPLGAEARRPSQKHGDENVAWLLGNIRDNAFEPGESGGVIDWFTLEPAKQSNRGNEPQAQQRRLRALEMLNVYSLWLTRYRKQLQLGHVLEYAFEASRQLPAALPVTARAEAADEAIARKYLARAQAAHGASLRFHLTMDVEAFPVTDIYAYHTATSDLLPRLIYSDFGEGSEIDELLHKNRVPCTYFLEAYSPVWSASTLSDAARFFQKDFTELGLHCHTFSLPERYQRGFGLMTGWFLKPYALAAVLRDGKLRLEAATGQSVTTYRSGRLDVYPELEHAVAEAGLRIDSSLADGHTGNYYADRSSQIGNALHRRGGVVEVPITTYRARERSRLLDFNGSSFEELCFVVVRALELGLPSVTMLMHSWSLSDVQELPLLGKGFHYASSPPLRDKLQRLLDFLDQLGCVQLSTLRGTVDQTPTLADEPGFMPRDFEHDPSPFQLLAWQEGESVRTRCVLEGRPFTGAAEFAFYLLLRGEKVATRWYQSEAEARFPLPAGTTAAELEVRGFARDQASPDTPLMKVVKLT